jgi:hypothetical protein
LPEGKIINRVGIDSSLGHPPISIELCILISSFDSTAEETLGDDKGAAADCTKKKQKQERADQRLGPPSQNRELPSDTPQAPGIHESEHAGSVA